MNQIEALNKRKDELMARQEVILNSATERKSKLTDAENEEFTKHEAEVKDITTNVARYEALAKGRADLKTPTTQPVVDASAKLNKIAGKRVLSAEYCDTFYKNFGKLSRVSADLLFEGADGDSSEGGVVAPVIYEGTVIPLAPQNMALRQLATVSPTSNDIKIPCQLTRSVAAVKDQTITGDTNSFSDTNPTVKLKTLSAKMMGNRVPASIESLADIGYLQAFMQSDISVAVLQAEEGEYTDVLLDPSDGATPYSATSVTIAEPESFLDVMAVQPSIYDNGSSWLMAKRTGFAIQKAQIEDNQFTPFWSVQNGQPYFHGAPVFYSSKMQDVGSPAADVVCYGNFKAGLIIGDRNQSSILIKVDDLTGFKDGVVFVYGYRRSGALVRNQDALRSVTL